MTLSNINILAFVTFTFMTFDILTFFKLKSKLVINENLICHVFCFEMCQCDNNSKNIKFCLTDIFHIEVCHTLFRLTLVVLILLTFFEICQIYHFILIILTNFCHFLKIIFTLTLCHKLSWVVNWQIYIQIWHVDTFHIDNTFCVLNR